MSHTKSLHGEATNGCTAQPVPSTWVYDSDDPWVVQVIFPEQEISWDFSLELILEAFTSSPGRLHGSGYLQIEIEGDHAYFHLSNGASSTTLRFVSEGIKGFLNDIDDHDSASTVTAELEEFLGAL